MAMQVEITVDVSKLKSAIKDVNYDIATLKVNGSNVTIGGKKINAEVKEIKKNINETANAAKKAGVEGAAAAAKTANGIKNLSTQTKGAIGFIGNMIKGFLTPWTLIIVAIDLAYKTIKSMYDGLTDSIEELIQKSQLFVKQSEKEISRFNNEKKAVDDLVKSLDELSKKGILNSEEQLRAQGIADRLNKKYKDLKITIDDIIGAIQDWDQAQKKIAVTNDKTEMNLLQQQYEAKKRAVEALMKDVTGDKNYTFDKALEGRDLFNFWQRNSPDTWGPGPTFYQIRQMGALYNSGDITGKRDSLLYFINHFTHDKKVEAAIDAFNELIDIEEKLNEYNNPGAIVDRANARVAEQIGGIEKEADRIATSNQKAKAALQKAQQEAEFNALPIEKQMQLLQAQAETTRAQIDALNQQAEAAASTVGVKLSDLDAMVAQVETEKGRIEKVDYDLQDALERQRNLQVQIGRAIDDEKRWYPGVTPAIWHDPSTAAYGWYTETLKPLEDQLAEVQKKRKELEAEKENLTTSFVDISANLADVNLRMKQSGLDYQETLAKSIELQQKLFDITKQWGELNTQQLAKSALELQKYQKAQDLIKNGVLSVESQILKKQGHEREALVLEQRRSIEKILERPLDTQKDKDLLNSIENYADIQMALNGLNEAKMNLQGDKVQANELARMGGFSSSIVVDRMDVNKEALRVAKRSSDYLNTINTGIQQIHDDLNF